jgi:hypothetical protein
MKINELARNMLKYPSEKKGVKFDGLIKNEPITIKRLRIRTFAITIMF